jgi:pimeloyl-ACP methyl ester carboxylesterase
MGATARASTRRDAAANAMLGVMARAIGVKPFIARRACATLFAAPFRAEHPGALAAWEARIGAMQGRDVARAAHAWSTRAALRDRLRGLRVPTLALVGDADISCPREHSEEIVAAIAGARLEVVARAGHTLPLERPEEIVSHLEAFLRIAPL